MKRIVLGLGIGLCFYACGENNPSGENSIENQTTNDTINSYEVMSSEDVPIDTTATGEYEHEVVVPDLQIAWGMDFLPDGSMLITEKSGALYHFENGQREQISNVPEVYNRGQGGLLDVLAHPDYDSNGWIYLTYSSTDGEGEGGNTKLIRAKLENNQLTQIEELYKATPNTTKGQHFGSRIAFDNEGYVYFSVGDRGNRDENPQNFTRDGGKVYRLNADGSIPEDNPFADRPDAVKAIYSYGHRNPQGMITHPETGEIWVHEHGPQGGDEINVVKKGENYGWPLVSYGINYDNTTFTEETSRPEFEDPIFYWDPSIAPSGFLYVTSDQYPELQGDLLIGSLKFMYIEHLELEDKTIQSRRKLLEGIGRIRDLAEGPDGYIYASVEGTGIVRILPNEQAE